jgi:hypothetical protein
VEDPPYNLVVHTAPRWYIEITPTNGGKLKIAVSKIGRIEFRNGRLVYLSDLKPAQVEQTPYFDRILGFRVNTSLNGGTLQLSDGPTTRGVAVQQQRDHIARSGPGEGVARRLDFRSLHAQRGFRHAEA